MIHALVGSESLLLRRALDRLLSEKLEGVFKDFNYDVFEGGELTSRRLLEAATLLPVMSPRRVVLIRNAEEIKKGEMENIAKSLSQIPDSSEVIFVSSKPDMRMTFWQELSRSGALKEFKPLPSRDIPRWILEETQRAGYRMDSEAANWLAATVGSDLSTLHSALEKIYLFKKGEALIHLADVTSCVMAFSWKTLFDLTDAVGQKNLQKALLLFKRMEASGESLIALLALLARHFRILSKVKEGDFSGIPPYFLKDYQRQASLFSLRALEQKREKIFYTDWALKSSSFDSSLIFERVLMELCSVGN